MKFLTLLMCIGYAVSLLLPQSRVIQYNYGARKSLELGPIGVPKVAYRMPGSRGGEWVDIYQRLTRERIIFLGSEIDDELANQIIGVLLVRTLFNLSLSLYFQLTVIFSIFIFTSVLRQ